jgi:Family of unknown function (DUF6221)
MDNELIAFLRARLDEREQNRKTRDEYDLRDVEAKRRIVDSWPDPFGVWSAEQADSARVMKGRVLRLLALPYSDHPDYRQDWRP